MPPVLSIVIPTLDAAGVLGATLADAAPGIARLAERRTAVEVVVADGGSRDGTADEARRHGAQLIQSEAGRGRQLAAGAAAAEGAWLLFLHADTHPAPGWDEEVSAFIAAPANQSSAACFRFALDDRAIVALLLERLVALRCRLFALPYGDQGLLIHRSLYDALGGFRPLPLMEDVDLVRRIGRKRPHLSENAGGHLGRALSARRLRTAHGAQPLLPAALLLRDAGRDGGQALRMKPGERHLAIFLKEPRLGRVKGRLARDIGHAEAWLFYRRLVRRVLPPLARDARWTTWLATTPAGWRGREPFWPLALPHLEQGRGDVGQRMLRVFRSLPPGPAIIVGSDIPDLSPTHVARGFAALGPHRHGAGAGSRRRLLADRAQPSGAGDRSLPGCALVEPMGARRYRARPAGGISTSPGRPPRRCRRRACPAKLARS